MQKDIYLSFHKTMGNKPVPFMCACVLWQILLGQSQRKKKQNQKSHVQRTETLFIFI